MNKLWITRIIPKDKETEEEIITLCDKLTNIDKTFIYRKRGKIIEVFSPTRDLAIKRGVYLYHNSTKRLIYHITYVNVEKERFRKMFGDSYG